MPNVCVTGGSGSAGTAVIQELLAHGYQCLNVDISPPRKDLCPFKQVDMRQYDSVHSAMQGCDVLVHFAGNPHPDNDHIESADRFENNTIALFNAFNAAAALGIKRVVWASSETIFGFPFETNAPRRIPLCETDEPDTQTGYAISKKASETIAELMAKQYGMTFAGLRLSNVLYDDPNSHAAFQSIPGYWSDMGARQFNLWGYIDSRDAARATRLAIEADLEGAEVFNIAAKDTVMRQPTRDLIAAQMPGTQIDAALTGRQAMLDCTKAQNLLGWQPEYHWPEVLNISVEALAEDMAE